MNLPKAISIIISNEKFLNYLFNRNHFIGAAKYSSLFNDNSLKPDLVSLISQLKQFPIKYATVNTNSIYKTELITKISITGPINLDNTNSILLKTYWIYKHTSCVLEFLTLSVVK